MENINEKEFIQFVRELKWYVESDKTKKEIATETMIRVAINNGFTPIYLW